MGVNQNKEKIFLLFRYPLIIEYKHYVREKRNVVVDIWGQVAQKVPNLRQGAQGGPEPLGLGRPAPTTNSGNPGHRVGRPQRKRRGDVSYGTLRECTVDSLMVSGGPGVRGHSREGQGPIPHHPALASRARIPVGRRRLQDSRALPVGLCVGAMGLWQV